MRVSELIELLQGLPPEAKVVNAEWADVVEVTTATEIHSAAKRVRFVVLLTEKG